jgi:ClpP class serine protease
LMLKTGELAHDVGTVLFGEEAVKNGLITEVGGLAAALKKLYEFIEIDRMKRGKNLEKGEIQ